MVKRLRNDQKKVANFEMGSKPIQKWDVGLIKVVSEFLFVHPKCHFLASKDGHFWQKCPYSGTKKWHFGCRNQNSETTFISPTSPKNDGIVFGFKCSPLLDGF